jgi:death-on-curing protein
MTEYLDLRHVLAAHVAIIGSDAVRDLGAIDSAAGRPRATAFGEDAYPTIWEKAAALMQSLARNHGFVDGNKRTAWVSVMTFLAMNGHPLDPVFDVDAAEVFVLAVATGSLADVPGIASELVKFTLR